MGVTYTLVNRSRREIVRYAHVPAWKKRELAGNPVSAAITTWYLLEHRGDEIAFVSDDDGEWPFSAGSLDELDGYEEVTDRVVRELVAAQILADHGVARDEPADPDEPDSVYIRDLRAVWMSD